MKVFSEKTRRLFVLIFFFLVICSSFVVAEQEQELSYLITVEREGNNLTEVSKTLEKGYYNFRGNFTGKNYSKTVYQRYNLTLKSFTGETLFQRSFLSPKVAYDLGRIDQTRETVALPYYENGVKAVFVGFETGDKKLMVDLTRFTDEKLLKENEPDRYKQLYGEVNLDKSVRALDDKFPMEEGEMIEVTLNLSNPNSFPLTGNLIDHNSLRKVKVEPEMVNYSLSIEPNSSVVKSYNLKFEKINLSFNGSQGRIEDIIQLGRASFSFQNKTVLSGKPVVALSKQKGEVQTFFVIAIVFLLALASLAGYKLKGHFQSQESGF